MGTSVRDMIVNAMRTKATQREDGKTVMPSNRLNDGALGIWLNIAAVQALIRETDSDEGTWKAEAKS